MKRFLNLDTNGNKGKSLLYRASPSSVVTEYNGVPYPHSNVIGEDIIPYLPADTDFSTYSNTSRLHSSPFFKLNGFDFAFYQNGYEYHTHLDDFSNIDPGSIQQVGENTLYLLTKYGYTDGILDVPLSNERYIYFDFMGIFISYPETSSIIINSILIVLLVIIPTLNFSEIFLYLIMKKKIEKLTFFGQRYGLILLFFFGYILSISIALILTLIMASLSNLLNPMSWYSSLTLAMFLYGLPTITGLIIGQGITFYLSWILTYKTFKDDEDISIKFQRERYLALFYVILIPLFFCTIFSIRSGYIFTISAMLLIISFLFVVIIEGVLISYLLSIEHKSIYEIPNKERKLIIIKSLLADIWILVPIIAGIIPAILAFDLTIRLLLQLIPIAGRAYINSDLITAMLVSISFILTIIVYLPFTHRGGNYLKIIGFLFFIIFILSIIFRVINPYTPETPKRYYWENRWRNSQTIYSNGTFKETKDSQFSIASTWDETRVDLLFTKYQDLVGQDPRIINLKCTYISCIFNSTLELSKPILQYKLSKHLLGTKIDFQILYENTNYMSIEIQDFTNITLLNISSPAIQSQNTYFQFFESPTNKFYGSFVLKSGCVATIKYFANYFDWKYSPIVGDIFGNVTITTIGPQPFRFTNLEFYYTFSDL